MYSNKQPLLNLKGSRVELAALYKIEHCSFWLYSGYPYFNNFFMQIKKKSAARTVAQKQSAEAAALATLAKRVPDTEERRQLLESAVQELFQKMSLQEIVKVQMEMLEHCVQAESFLNAEPYQRASIVSLSSSIIAHAIDLDFLSESIAFTDVLQKHKLLFPDVAFEN